MKSIVAMLGSYGTTLWLEHVAGLRVDVVVLAVFLAVSLSRALLLADALDRAIGFVLVPVVMVGAGQVGVWMAGEHIWLGSALFVVAVSATIWVRRWGPRFAVAGMLATAPLISTLILPAVPVRTHILWTAPVAMIAYAWVAAIIHTRNNPRVQILRTPVIASGGLLVSTRMAVQMGLAVAAAFVVGHVLLGENWSWVVLTAFLVGSGNRGRVDVLRKSVLRVAGAVAGTAAATGLVGLLAPPWQVVAIFVLLAVGTWLRPFSYAYWAGSVTAALAFLYGYFGQAGAHLLLTRIGGIVLGGVIGVAAAWFVLPIGGQVTGFRAWLARVCAMVCRPIRRGPRLP